MSHCYTKPIIVWGGWVGWEEGTAPRESTRNVLSQITRTLPESKSPVETKGYPRYTALPVRRLLLTNTWFTTMHKVVGAQAAAQLSFFIDMQIPQTQGQRWSRLPKSLVAFY